MNRTCSIDPTPAHWEAVDRVLASGCWVAGSETDAFEEEFAAWIGVDRDRVVALSSGTAALTALLLANGIGPGDEVIVPAITFTATALAVLRAGAKPVLADVNAAFCLSPASVEAALSDQTAAVIGVDLDGVPADWNALRRALPEGLFLIEDACAAVGARYSGRMVGTLEVDGTAFSFNESKQLPAGEGGMVVAPYSAAADRIRRMRHFGHDAPMTNVSQAQAVGLIGDNWKITEMAAALARAGLASLNERVMASRLVAQILREAMVESDVLSPAPRTPNSEPSFYRVRGLAPDPGSAIRTMLHLEKAGVPLTSREEVAPLQKHPMFAECRRVDLRNAEQASRSFCFGSRSQQVFYTDPRIAEGWAEVITSLPAELVSPRTRRNV